MMNMNFEEARESEDFTKRADNNLPKLEKLSAKLKEKCDFYHKMEAEMTIIDLPIATLLEAQRAIAKKGSSYDEEHMFVIKTMMFFKYMKSYKASKDFFADFHAFDFVSVETEEDAEDFRDHEAKIFFSDYEENMKKVNEIYRKYMGE